MANIKVKESKKGTVKTLNKAVIGTEKMKNRIVETKEKINETNQNSEDNSTNYAINKITTTTQNTPYTINKLNSIGKNNFKQTKENFNNINSKIKYAKKRNHAKKVAKNMTKSTSKTIKTAEQTSKNAIKTAERTGKNIKVAAKNTAKTSQRVIQVTKNVAIKTAQTIKATVKLTISAIKAIITGTKALIAAIIAGGWIVGIIIIVICIIAMLVSSVFGIFFSSEDTGSTITVNETEQGVTMNEVISDLNTEFMDKITEIQQNNEHDEYDIQGQRTELKDVLAIYSVKVSGEENEKDVVTINDEKVQILKDIFWQMNEITSSTEEITKTIETTDSEGNTTSEEKTIKMLHITINGKTTDEMANQYEFSQEQKEKLEELIDEKYASMWSAVIYGSSVGSNDIVKVALEQVGNVGGQPYWSWYGFSSRVEWCACFVSWCAEQCGYIKSGTIPKFASCQSEGVAWFKTCGLWKDGGYSPKARRYNIF